MFKLVLLFNGVGPCGWTELIYVAGTDPQQVVNGLTSWINARLALVGQETTLLAIRVTQVGVPGVSNIFPINRTGPTGQHTDTPWQALLCKLGAAAGSQRNFWLRGIPDTWISNGTFTDWVLDGPGGVPSTLVKSFLAITANGVFRINAINRNITLEADVISVTAAGAVTLNGAGLGVAIGDNVRFLRTKYDGGGNVTGTFRVLTVAGDISFTLKGWSMGKTVSKGTMRQLIYVPQAITSGLIDRIGLRKVGRPFAPYHGRAPKGR
jgi:hypothetical protein